MQIKEKQLDIHLISKSEEFYFDGWFGLPVRKSPPPYVTEILIWMGYARDIS